MSTFRLPILSGVLPIADGVFWEPYSIKATNDLLGGLVLIMNDTATRKGARGGFQVPQNYVGTAKIIVEWTSTAITGAVAFDVDYRAIGGNDAESFDQATVQESVTVTDTAPTAAHNRLIAELPLTSTNLAAGDKVLFEFFRDGLDAADTMAGPVICFDVYFEYNDA